MIRDNNQPTHPQASSCLLDPGHSPLRLQFLGSQRRGQVVRINSSKCTIGSAPEATFRLVCPGVQPIHCLVLRGQNGMVIRRMSIDTLLNGRAFEDAPLTPGDRISIGPIDFEVLAGVDARRVDQPASPASTTTTELSEKLTRQRSELDQAIAAFQTQQDLWNHQRNEEQLRLDNLARELEERMAALEEVSPPQGESHSDSLSREIETLKSQLEQANIIRQRELEEWGHQREDFSSQLATTQSELAQKTEELASVGSELTAIRGQLQQLEAAQPQGVDQAAFDELQSQYELLNDQLELAQREKQEWTDEQQQLREQVEASESKVNDQLLDQQEKWTAERAELEQQLEAKQVELTELQTRLEQPEPVEDGTNDEVAALEAEIAQLQSAREADRSALESTRAELQQVLDQFENLKTELQFSQVNAEVQSELEEKLQQSENERESALQQLGELRAELAKQEQAWEATRQPELTPADSYEAPEPSSSAVEPEDTYDAGAVDPAMALLDRLREEVSEDDVTSSEAGELEAAPADPSYDEATATVVTPAEVLSNPTSEEELTFSEPDEAAPVDTASILAQFGHTMEEVDEHEEDLSATMTSPVSPAIAAEPLADIAALVGNDDEESIEDYMTQLMQRCGGGTYGSNSVTDARVTTPTPTQLPTQQNANLAQAKAKQNTLPLDPLEFVPRAVAPEAASNLQALRAVANTSARSAIEKHQRSSFSRNALVFWSIALVAGIVCFTMAFFATTLISLPTLLCLVTFVVSLVSALKALAYSAKSKFGARLGQKQLPAIEHRSESPKSDSQSEPANTPSETQK